MGNGAQIAASPRKINAHLLTTTAAQATTKTPETPKKSAPAAVTPLCTNQPANDGLPFANCPSISFNFAAMPNGPLSTHAFNVYTGTPEANHEAQLYTRGPENLRIENGRLVLEALAQTRQGFKYTSARVDTTGKEDFLYGKLVVRAILPDGVGTWPAIWMLPTDKKYENLSPPSDFTRYLNDGEIDIAESIGTEPHVVYGIAHSLAYPPDTSTGYYSTLDVPDNNTIFHDYGVNWTPTNLAFTVDGKPYFSIDKQPGADYHSWPYDQRYHLILNLALGGSWGGTDTAQFPGDGVDTNALPAAVQVQSINYYPYTGVL